MNLNQSDLVSVNFIRLSQQILIYLTFFLTGFGIISNILAILIFYSPNFRKQSSHLYLLALAISDLCFLIINLFEDAFRNHNYLYNSNVDFLDRSTTFICILVQYIRNISRLTSSWIVVLFTIERLIVVFYPLKRQLICRRKIARYELLVLVIISSLLNINVPFHYGIVPISVVNNTITASICDLLPKYRSVYMSFAITTIISVYLIPMCIIGFVNILIVNQLTSKNDSDIDSFDNENNHNATQDDESLIRRSLLTQYPRKLSTIHEKLVRLIPTNRQTQVNLKTKKDKINLRSKSYSVSDSILHCGLFSEINHNNKIKISKSEPTNTVQDYSKSNTLEKYPLSILLQNQDNSTITPWTSEISPCCTWNSADCSNLATNILLVDSEQQMNQKCNNSEKNLFQSQTNYVKFNDEIELPSLNHDRITQSCSFTSFHEKLNVNYSLYAKSLRLPQCQRKRINSLMPNNYRTSICRKNSSNVRKTHLKDRTQRITVTLLLVSCSFLLLNTPYCILWLLNYLNKFEDQKLKSIKSFTELFMLTNFCINFLLYCIGGKLFRLQLKYLLRCTFIINE
ncbi:unnamed protein product [Didymodactylos carnosus]|uniref:G-protein coupled receptors family 1 profile domain-containing protein n=1 Tax=Didymodactylos carnosus TaxID=1234261 RepID=A0A814ZP43_9BILA|nr:unnamed protein product [Didymodactylos carnosus]CAF1244460.1 unnamed protein product [Didymodactylos carnosus]CAF3902830.1 unnamed protein product [Didymodactylos carnosus]CAF4009379.1 unnamed protein product [Didymodactylos carnosus]